MNVQIITSSYPAYPDDPSGTAGLFVRAYALELQKLGHKIIVQPVGRKPHYCFDDGLTISPLEWKGGDKELASINFFSPYNWFIIFVFFLKARTQVVKANQQYQIDRTLCMWALPSGLLGLCIKKTLSKPFDVWVLGSDIWKIGKLPLLGRFFLKRILGSADRVFADGLQLCQEAEQLSGRSCRFLPSSRDLVGSHSVEKTFSPTRTTSLLYVGRYHKNKGPDLLLEAVQHLPHNVREKVKLRMFGLGPLRESLVNCVREHHLEKYITVGDGIETSALIDEMQRATYLVIPSRLESIPVIFSDALQMATPIIATPAGDLPKLISENHCGFLADDFSALALAQVIEDASRNENISELSKNARALWRKFSPSETAKLWLTDTSVSTTEDRR